MKIKILFLIAFSGCFSQYAVAQTPGTTDIGVGYFNDHQFATFGTISGTPPTLTGNLAGNAFTISFSGNTSTVLHTISGYGPKVPANSGSFSVAFAELNYSAVPATSLVTFTNALQPLDELHAVDIENSESVTFEFLDATSTPVAIANNIKIVSLSTISPTASLNYPSSTMVGINTSPNKITATNSDQGFSFVMLTNVVKTIRFIQTSSSTGGSWDFTFSKGTADRGDAPASYGNATHLSLAAQLKLGSNGGDAEGSVFSSGTATGDNAVAGSTVINDEDGIPTVPAIANNGTRGQVISSYSVSTTVTNTTGASANVVAWADWNGDGVFNASEAVVASVVPTGSAGVSRTFTWTNKTLGGSTGITGTYLRVRTTTGSLTANDATGFSPDGEVEDYFAPFAATLPVTFNAFSVTPVSNGHVLLQWKTEAEQNNTGFEIDHSADGLDWKAVGFVPTRATGGNSSGLLQYRFTHSAPSSGANYYRLKQIDLDGRALYSDIRNVDISNDGYGITINPNPADDAVTIHGVKEGDLISLYNSNGLTIVAKKANASQVYFDLSRFAQGVYTIVVRAKAGGLQSFKLVKK